MTRQLMSHNRHAELVCASTPSAPASRADERKGCMAKPWTLERQSPQVKQVQGDEKQD